MSEPTRSKLLAAHTAHTLQSHATARITTPTWQPGQAAPGLVQVLPLHEDGTVLAELDIVFSTHMTLVVPGRIEFACGAQPQELDLVVARAQCRNHRPLMRALVEAAQSALARTGRRVHGTVADLALPSRRPHALMARVAGQWQALWSWQPGAPVLALP